MMDKNLIEMFNMIPVTCVTKNTSKFIKHPHKLHTQQTHDGALPSHELSWRNVFSF